MSSRPRFPFALLALTLLCTLAVVAWWRHSAAPPAVRSPEPPAARARPVVAPPVAPAAGSTPVRTLSPELTAAVAALFRALASPESRAREAVLVFRDDAALQRFLSRASEAGVSVLRSSNALLSARVRLDSLDAFERDLVEFGDDIASLGANPLVSIPSSPTAQDRAAQNEVPFRNEALDFLGASGDRGNWGRGVTVAILDTGIDADATFGAGRVRALDIGLGLSPGTGREDGHGTAVGALAAGMATDAPGVAPAANLLSIRVTDANGTSDLFTLSQGIVAAVDAGAKVINISLGGYSGGAVLDRALTYAEQAGVVVVAAAGNDQAAQLAWPAADPRVVSVGAVDRAEQQVSFSNAGEQLTLTAPGYGVQTAWLNGQRVYIDGTSASAPFVAGSIAALLSQNPGLTPRQAADLLARTASDAGAPGADPAFGRGIVNLATALNVGNPTYVDTAVSSHYYNPATQQMEFVVQNRSGRPITGLTLSVSNGTTTTTQTVPSLSIGESYVARAPVSEAALRAGGTATFTTQLNNPFGVTDQIPANNRRTSVLSGPKP